MVGFISIWEPDSFIHHHYVLPKCQSMGIGKMLHDTGVKMLTNPVKLKCLKGKERALDFYMNQGWVVIEDGLDDLG